MRKLIVVWVLLLVGCASKVTEVVEGEQTVAQRARKASVINMQLGLGYLKQGDVQRAKRKLFSAIQLAPRSADAVGAMAYYFESTGRYDEAQKYYHRAMSLAPGRGAQLNNFGAFLCRRGQYQQATKYFERATEDLNYVNSAGAYENAGLCALAIPNIAQAEYYLKKALAQDPKREKSLYELSKLALKQRQYQKVLTYVAQYENFFPLKPAFLSVGFLASKKLGLNDKAQSYKWVLENKFPNSTEYRDIEVRYGHGKLPRAVS